MLKQKYTNVYTAYASKNDWITFIGDACIATIDSTDIMADMDSDGDVDGLDLHRFGVVYSNNTFPDADIDGDGLIDANDVDGFAYEYGKNQ